MNVLAMLKSSVVAVALVAVFPVQANELQEMDGPNVRTMKQEDGSNSVFVRSPDSKTLTKKTYSANGVLTMVTTYRMDADGNPRGCKIKDGANVELFKVSYGYNKITGQLVEELMYDARTKRTVPGTDREMPVQKLVYLYDAEGKRSAPIVYNLLPGKTFEQVFGVKSSALETNPFKDGKR